MITINEVKNTALISDFRRLKFVPTLNKLLDWRNELIKLKSESDENQDLFDLEIKATDYLIQEFYSDDKTRKTT